MKTKVIIFVFLTVLFTNYTATAQDEGERSEKEYVTYAFFFNVVPDEFNFPLIGFVNVARGSYKGLELGFVNTTLKDFRGLKMGFVNTTLGNSSGTKLGFVNTTIGNTSGLQMGFVNISGKGTKGSQIGFINVADSSSNGVPIGFLSIVKKGGYRAIEISANELYPFNLAFKIGIPGFYTFFQGSYNHNYGKPYAVGLGFGSLVPLGKGFYFNPEVGSLYPMSSKNNTSLVSFGSNVRYSLNSKLQVAAGLSAVWLNHPKGENRYDPPFFSLANYEINGRNRILAGVRIALSYNFTDLR